MGDLEDSILKQNVPGRYSSWSEENDDQRRGNTSNDIDDGGKYYNQDDNSGVIGAAEGGSDDEDDDYYYQGLPPPPPPPPLPSSATTAATATGPPRALGGRPTSNNTGVKGVLADYHAAEVEERLLANETKLDEYNAWYRMTHPAVRKSDNTDGNRRNNDEQVVIADNEEDGGSDNNYYDEDELIIIRRRRLMQLKEEQQHQHHRHHQLPRYGSLTCVTPDEYVNLVNNQQEHDTSSFLIVHLAEYDISQCCVLHSVLEKIASLPNMEHGHNFIEVEALIAKPNLDTICLPTVLVYQHGVLIHNLVRFTDDLPREFGVEDVISIFIKLGIVVGV